VVGPLLRLKLDVVRGAWAGTWPANAVAGLAVGTGVAVATIWLAAVRSPDPTAQRDLLALAVGAWVLGWGVAPALAGEPLLPARFFAHLGLDRRRLAGGLVVACVVGLPGAVTLVALAGVPVFAGRWAAAGGGAGGGDAGGPGVAVAVLAALPLVVLLLALAGLLNLLAGRLFSTLSATRPGAAATGAVIGLLLVSTQWGWIVLVAIEVLWESGFSETTSGVVSWLPTSWGVRGAAAAANGSGGTYIGLLAALAALDAVLLVAWARVVDRPARRLAVRGPRRPGRFARVGLGSGRVGPGGTPAATGLVLARELAVWGRDVVRIQAVAASVVFAVASAALPLAFDSSELLPWAGAFAVVLLAATTCNPLGQDGTVLWLPMQVPGALAAEVRGRQAAWTLVALVLGVPLALAGSVAGDVAVGPLAATVVMAVAGGGIIGWLAVVALVPAPDPRAARDRPLDHGDVAGLSFTALLAAGLSGAPVLVLAFVSAPAAVAAAVVAGSLALALALAWWTARLATAALEARAPELLAAMRSHRTAPVRGAGPAGAGAGGYDDLSPRDQLVLRTAITVGMIALFPQALVPVVMKLTGNVAPVWFLPLHLPAAWQWPAIAAMAAVAAAAFAVAHRTYRRTSPAA
jgi:ABC-2 type transport system permease protein